MSSWLRKKACSFVLRKRTEKTFIPGAQKPNVSRGTIQAAAAENKSLFASFSSEKEDSFLSRFDSRASHFHDTRLSACVQVARHASVN
jgi:hypothetical protein